MLREFLLLLREIIGVNRAAIFLRQPPARPGEPLPPAVAHRLYSACAMGLAPGVLEHLELSLEAGIGGYLFRSGRLLRRDSAEVERDPQMRREFDLLGAQVAIPVLDREIAGRRGGVRRARDGRAGEQRGTGADLPSARTAGPGGQEYLAARQGFGPARNDV